MKTNKFFDLILYVQFFLIIFFASAIIFSQIILKGETVTLPDITGNTLEEARAELSQKKISVVLKGTQFDNDREKGKIIFQDPSPGSRVKINKAVKVILSAGSEKVVVPRLIGRSFQSIREILSETDLARGKVSQVHTSRYAAGKIISQYPLPEEEVARNSPLSLLVSQGERAKKYLMPDLIGKQAEIVLEKLKSSNFRVEVVGYSYYPGQESGIILKQFPDPGYSIQKNYPITLEVSKE